VRTFFEIEDEEAYPAARDLLLRRCGRWASTNCLTLDPGLAEAILDSRHFSSDGRLGYWTPAQVRRALLEWIPERVTARPPGAVSARTLGRRPSRLSRRSHKQRQPLRRASARPPKRANGANGMLNRVRKVG